MFIVDGQRWFDAFDNAIAEISERSASSIKVVFKEQVIDSYILEFGVRRKTRVAPLGRVWDPARAVSCLSPLPLLTSSRRRLFRGGV